MPLDVTRFVAAGGHAFPPEAVREAVQVWIEYRLLDEPALVTDSREAYVEHHLARSLAAMALIPPRRDRGRLLELGSGIYLMTFLLEKLCNYDLELVQYWGRPSGKYETVLVSSRTGERKSMPFVEANAEAEPLPYADGSFDVIVNCDTIEHVLCNPMHMLAECHRVLRPGGVMVLTTPNVLRLDNVVRLFQGRNIYDKYVLDQPSARHPREYTPEELRRVLEWAGFEVSHLDTRDVSRSEVTPQARSIARWCLQAFAATGRLVGRDGANPAHGRGEQIIAAARRSQPANSELPEFLFEAPGISRKVIDSLYGERRPK